MSVLEDVLDLLRTVLEYFGVPREMVSCHSCTLFVCGLLCYVFKWHCLFHFLEIFSWCQCGTASCVDSIAALSVWSGPIFLWHLHPGSTSRYTIPHSLIHLMLYLCSRNRENNLKREQNQTTLQTCFLSDKNVLYFLLFFYFYVSLSDPSAHLPVSWLCWCYDGCTHNTFICGCVVAGWGWGRQLD